MKKKSMDLSNTYIFGSGSLAALRLSLALPSDVSRDFSPIRTSWWRSWVDAVA